MAEFCQIAEIAADIVGGRRRHRPVAGEVRGEIGEVAAISAQRIFPGAALGSKHVEKQRHHPLVGAFGSTRRTARRFPRDLAIHGCFSGS
jgi:hypothetical protein